jgi:YjbE family integral membrane protein
MDFSSGALWGALLAIIVANILLSGDNAVVIAMAARSLKPEHQKKAIIWGSAAAIIMRVILTIVAVKLLTLPYLKLIGGVLLFWIGYQLLTDNDEEADIKSHATIGAAIRTILVADLVMSLDNVIAVASAADKAPESARFILLMVGLAMSIPLIIAGSTLLIKVMDKYPVIITGGAALLGFLAGSMMVSDPSVVHWFEANVDNAEALAGGLGAVLVVLVAKWMSKRQAKAE